MDLISASFNQGWTYRQRIAAEDSGRMLVEFLATHYSHSSRQIWQQRLQSGQIQLNGELVTADQALHAADWLCWQRPAWLEPEVPGSWQVLFDDGDLLVMDKPSGLPVMPGGGFLKHTLVALLQKRFGEEGKLPIPRPVHRLGRFTSGLLLCARQAETRAHLSGLFRRATAGEAACKKMYLALAQPNPYLDPGEIKTIKIPIVQQPHPLLGQIWAAAAPDKHADTDQLPAGSLSALSTISLLEHRQDADLLDVTIQTGRPHQIRIHLAAIGTPLIGDPLYGPHGNVSPSATPGEGGYSLHAHRLVDVPYAGRVQTFEACPPLNLQTREERQ